MWKEPSSGGKKGPVETRSYNYDRPLEEQPPVTVDPGQMIFVITYEDILMPINLCGTVYSTNDLAKKGILALNAGHVDPGFEGPIVIRLINLRVTPWTLTLGTPIFTIVFQTLDVMPGDTLVAHDPIPADKTLLKVRDSADAALSNALLDLYDLEMGKRLYEHYASVEGRIRTSLSEEFLKRNEFGGPLFIRAWGILKTILAILVVLVAFAASGVRVGEFIQRLYTGVTNSPTQTQPPTVTPNPTEESTSAPTQTPAVPK